MDTGCWCGEEERVHVQTQPHNVFSIALLMWDRGGSHLVRAWGLQHWEEARRPVSVEVPLCRPQDTRR